MKKTILATTLASIMGFSAVASADVTQPTIYGQVNLSAEHVTDQADGFTGENDSETTLRSRDSFVGVKGSEGLNNGLQFVYDAQLGFEYDTQNSDKDFELRKGDIGVAGSMFSVHAGRLANPYVEVSKQYDIFDNTLAESVTVIGSDSLEHTDKSIAGYITPAKGFNFAVMASLDAEEDTLANQEADIQAYVASYDLEGLATVFAGYQNIDYSNFDYEIKSYKLGAAVNPSSELTLSLTGEKTDYEFDDQTNVLAQAGFDVSPVVTLKAGYGRIGSTDSDNSGNMYALGADYKLGQNTTVGATLARADVDVTNLNGYGTYVAQSDTNTGFSVGISHKF